MAGSAFEPIHIPDTVWRRDTTTTALRNRDIGALFQLAHQHAGASQNRIAAATGVPQPRVNALMKQTGGPITALHVFENIANGLNMPDFAREALGIASRYGLSAEIQSSVSVDSNLGLDLPNSSDERVQTVDKLWHSDLAEEPAIVGYQFKAQASNKVLLKWLLAKQQKHVTTKTRRVGESDVLRVRATTDLFAQMDNQFGGGHARHALISFLARDVTPLISGSFHESVGNELFSAAAEATLLAAWMAYDSGLHGLAQRYFIQALSLSEAGDNRILSGSILDAMSHQATFVGRFDEAAELIRAAHLGTQSVATPTLKAHFHVMEARALAKLGDAPGCDHALADAVKEFELRNPEDDPEWIRYFDEAELAAEFGHCFRDLGRPVNAVEYASQSLENISGAYQRSDFFAAMILADSHLRSDEAEKACEVALSALDLGQHLNSARCVGYVREFRTELENIGSTSIVSTFEEQVKHSSLWLQARPLQTQ